MHPFHDSSPITLRMSAGRLLHKVGAATAKEQPSIVVSVLVLAAVIRILVTVLNAMSLVTSPLIAN